MKRRIKVLVAVAVFVLAQEGNTFASDVLWEDIGGGNLNAQCVLVDPVNPRIIYLGAKGGVFKTEDGGKNWRNVLLTHGQNRGINFLLFDPQDRNSLYAATGNGLFRSFNAGRNWERVFRGRNTSENECIAVAVLPYGIFLGTKAGLFVSRDKGRRWHKDSSKLGNAQILAISYNLKAQNSLYVACVDGLFKTDDAGGTWERIFFAQATENGGDEEEATEDRDEEEKFSCIRYVRCDPQEVNYIYLATDKGIYLSQDKGKSWDLLSGYGLLNRDIKFLLLSDKSQVYALANAGVFKYEDRRWQELTFALSLGQMNGLALDKEGNLYVAGDKGLFRARADYFAGNPQESVVMSYSKDEPKIKEVQQAAIKYAEVDPKKIIRWRKQAAKKAFLPQVNTSVGRNVTDLWHWETGSSTRLGDDVLNKGNDAIEWDVTLSWDLGEIIWNSDQTSIDVRSRLMVQLRDDILDEVTKIYFERLRVKMELDNLSIEERKKRFEKELRLEELTASLDALTGGYFSQQIKGKS